MALSPRATASSAVPYSPSELAAASERAGYGLDSSLPTVRSIISAGLDVGTAAWGIVLTADEESELDLPGRAAFANELAAKVLPYLETIDSFGGLYIDQSRNGLAVALLTTSNPAIEQGLAAATAGLSRGVAIEYVASTEAQLEAAAHEVWAEWPKLTKQWPESVEVDTRANRILVEVAPEAVSAAQEAAATLAVRLGVALSVRAADPSLDASCTDRFHCATPMRAGMLVLRGTANPATAEAICTMAFHITKGTDEQWLTAGHCGYSGSNNWYSQSFGLIGAELATLYVPNGIDAMRIQMSDAQASNWIYDKSLRVTATRLPILGEGVCASLGYSDAWDCGTVASTQLSWISSTCSCVVWGADADNITINDGDSGSPLTNNTLSGSYYGIGIIDTLGGHFAKADSVINSFSASLYVP